MSILLTGFEPFGGAAGNPSGRLVRQVAGEMSVAGRVLPVDSARIGDCLRESLLELRPDLLLCVGVAGRPVVSVERVAINVLDFRIPDNGGHQPCDAPVVPGGPAAYLATVPVKAMLAALTSAGVPAEISNTAGTFLCNQAMYLGLHLAERLGLRTRVGFLHIPWSDADDAPEGAIRLSEECLRNALRLAVNAALGDNVSLNAGREF